MDKTKVIKEYEDYVNSYISLTTSHDYEFEMHKAVLELLKEQETVVRCISCTFYRSDGECALHNGRWKPEGFCSWAIRKEGR